MANRLDNGAFDEALDDWTGTGSIAFDQGYPRQPCVLLADGQSISQAEPISADQLHTLHFFYRPASGATLTVSYGSVSRAFGVSVADQWHEGVMPIALAETLNGSVDFLASAAAVHVDTVALLYGGLAMSRGQIATIVAADVEALATDAGLTTTVSSKGPEGDYSSAIDEALRANGAINRWGDPDVTMLQGGQINDVLEAAKRAVFQNLQTRYALQTDVSLGPRRESLSQKAKALADMASGGAGDRRIQSADLAHRSWRR